jgi:hypothetical protein
LELLLHKLHGSQGWTLYTGLPAIQHNVIVGLVKNKLYNVFQKMSGERMTGRDYLTDVGTGALIGVVTGGIGAGGAAVANTAAKEVTKGVAKGAVDLAVRAGAGAVAGATGNVINGVVKGEEITVGSVAKSAVCGVVGTFHLDKQ